MDAEIRIRRRMRMRIMMSITTSDHEGHNTRQDDGTTADDDTPSMMGKTPKKITHMQNSRFCPSSNMGNSLMGIFMT
jgi:hypothetical protein